MKPKPPKPQMANEPYTIIHGPKPKELTTTESLIATVFLFLFCILIYFCVIANPIEVTQEQKDLILLILISQ